MESFRDILVNNGRKITVRIANARMIGVYILAAFETNVSVFALRSVASSIKERIFDTVLVA